VRRPAVLACVEAIPEQTTELSATSIRPGAVGMDAIKQKFATWRGMVSDSTWKGYNVWVDRSTIGGSQVIGHLKFVLALLAVNAVEA
jgi:hypothetical protein